MRLVKRLSLLSLVFVVLFTLTSCGLESYAEKINAAAKDGKNYTYGQVVKQLGENKIIDNTINVGGATGAVILVKGCKTWEDVSAKLEAGKEVKGLVVVFALGKAQSAAYRVITPDDAKAK